MSSRTWLLFPDAGARLVPAFALILLLFLPSWAQDKPRVSTALHRAALAGDVAAAEKALAEDDIEAQNTEGRTALHLASKYGHLKVVELLLESGAKVNASCYDGQTSLHLAAAAGNFNVVDVLLKAGAEVNTRDKDGNTPIHLAALSGREGTVSVLLENEALAGLTNEKGETPVDLAQKARVGSWRLVVRALEDAAAEQGPVEGQAQASTQPEELPTERLPSEQLEPASWATIEFFSSYNLIPSMTRVEDLQNVARLREQWGKCYAKMAQHATPEFLEQKKVEYDEALAAIADFERQTKGKTNDDLRQRWTDQSVRDSFYESNRRSNSRIDVVAQKIQDEYATVLVMVPSTDPRTPDRKDHVYVRLINQGGKWLVFDVLQ